MEGEVKAKFQTTTPFHARTAHLDFVELGALTGSRNVHSLPRGKERTKKTRPDVPSGTSLLCRSAKKETRGHI